MRFRSGEGEVVLHSSVQGLVSEAPRVVEALETEKPGIVALGLSPEAVGTLLRYQKDPEVDPFEELPDHDFVYIVKLREFGPVDLPAPDLLATIAWARTAGVTCYGADLPEEAYEDLYTKEVSAFGLLRYGRIQRRIASKPPKATEARAFSIAWDAAIRKVKGIARVEDARETCMAAQAIKLASGQAAKVFLLVDAPREAGVARHLAGSQ